MESTETPAPTPRERQPNRLIAKNNSTTPPLSVDSSVPGAHDVTAELAAVRGRIAEAIGEPSETD